MLIFATMKVKARITHESALRDALAEGAKAIEASRLAVDPADRYALHSAVLRASGAARLAARWGFRALLLAPPN